ncbi:hypothetical protein ACHAWT_004909 [Skeletonema menzelii]|eukprot:scaffold15872_cov145-Skeletonema_menzelii.AAC.6
MSKPAAKTPPTPRYTSIFCEFMAHFHQKPEPYPKDHEFEENDLLAITPNDIVRWMNAKAFGKAEPDENSQLVGSSWSSLGFMKKSISFFMPRTAPWDPIEGRGNPTKSQEVKNLLLRVKSIEDNRKKGPDQMQAQQQSVEEIVTAMNSADGASGLLQKIQARNSEFIQTLETMGASIASLGTSIEQMKSSLESSNNAIAEEISNQDSASTSAGEQAKMAAFISELPDAMGLASKMQEDVSKVAESLQGFMRNPILLSPEMTITPSLSGYCAFTEDGKSYDIPAGFIFPQCNLHGAWRHWLTGFPDHKIRNNKNEIIDAPIKPLRLVSLGNVHQSAKKKFKDGWRPILIFMQTEIDQDLDSVPMASVDEAFIKMTYEQAMSALHRKAPSMTTGKNEQKHVTWKVATWSRKIREEQLGPTQGAQHRPVIPLPPAPVVHVVPQAPVPRQAQVPPPAQFVPPIPTNNMQLPSIPDMHPDDMRI